MKYLFKERFSWGYVILFSVWSAYASNTEDLMQWDTVWFILATLVVAVLEVKYNRDKK